MPIARNKPNPRDRQRPWVALLLAAASCAALAALGFMAADVLAAEGAASAATSGTAAAGGIPHANLLDILRSGGVLMWPILFCSFVLLVFTFERAIALRRGNILPRPFVKRFLHQLRQGQLTPAEALQRCEENGSPIAQVFAGAVRKWGRPAVEVEQGIIDAGERVSNHLRRYLRVINGVATVTPLLGLLGTVVGMIVAFNDIAGSRVMGHPGVVANGISQALLTTAAGLSVAIPALIIYLYFVGCVDRRISEMDALGQEVVQLVAHDALPEGAAKKAEPPRKTKAA